MTAMNDKQKIEEQLKFLSQLSGELAHELRNPLSTIGLNLQLLIEDYADRPDEEKDKPLRRLKRIQAEIDRLNRLLNDFLKITRGNKLDLAPLEINMLIEEILVFLEPEANRHEIRVMPIYHPEKIMIDADRNQLKQALINIIQNAIQAIDKSGDIFIKVYPVKADAVIEIIDTGCGLDSEDLKKVFEPFYTTKENGTGLGLAATRRIIENHSGTIKVFSEKGKGTQFILKFPRN
jgi:signal transduction histidine kinase